MEVLKDTSYAYGTDYQKNQIKKYKNRANNHWKHRFEIFDTLIKKAEQILEKKTTSEISVVDIGCSIGTFALEAARLGYKSAGIDFDKEAINIAKQLANEESVKVNFICGDISNDVDFNEEIDIAVCFDIFEHLHDDEMGAFLKAIKNKLSKKGVLIFHTFPTQYDYIFFSKFAYIPLLPYAILSKKFFLKVTKIYVAFIDSILLLFKGKTHKDIIKNYPHCNPTTEERMIDLLTRSGFKNDFMEVKQLYPFKKRIQNIFKKHPISYRNLYGIVSPKK